MASNKAGNHPQDTLIHIQSPFVLPYSLETFFLHLKLVEIVRSIAMLVLNSFIVVREYVLTKKKLIKLYRFDWSPTQYFFILCTRGKNMIFKGLKKFYGGAGYRSRYLSHAKRALYHLSYAPSLECILYVQHALAGRQQCKLVLKDTFHCSAVNHDL